MHHSPVSCAVWVLLRVAGVAMTGLEVVVVEGISGNREKEEARQSEGIIRIII